MSRKYIFFVVALILPFSIKALSATPSINCDKNNLEIGESANCSISVSVSDGEVTTFTSSISASDNITLSANSFTLNSLTEGNHSVGSFTVTAVNSGSASVNVTNTADGEDIGSLINSFEIKAKDASLDSLSVEGEALSPAFSKDVYEYTLTTEKSSIKINATSENGTISGAGEKTLKDGTNTFEVSVSGGKPYKIIVTKTKQEEKKKEDSTLKSIELSSGSISFKPTTLKYSVEVESNVNTVKVTGIPSKDTSTVKYNPSNSVNLKYGETKTISIVVLASDNTSTTYEISITRKEEKEKSNTNIKSLTIEGVDFNFSPDKISYNITVTNDITEIKINYELEDNTSVAKIEGKTTLKEGKNQIRIVVTGKDNSTKTYLLNITRSKDKVSVRNDEEAILEKLNDSEDKSQLYVTVNKSEEKTISTKILEALKDTKKIINYEIINEYKEMVYSLKLNGKDIKNTNEFNYQLVFVSENDSKIHDLVNSNEYLTFNFKDNNKYPSNMDLVLYVGDRSIRDLKSINLYKYDSKQNKLVLIKKDIKIEDSYITLTLDEENEYVLANVGKKSEEQKTSMLPVIIIIVFFVMISIYLIIRKPKSQRKNKADKKNKDQTNEEDASEPKEEVIFDQEKEGTIENK